MMNKRILVGVDANFSSATQYAVRALGEFIQDASPTVYLILLHTIPITQVITEQPGYYVEQFVALSPSSEERKQAEEVLQKARMLLQQQGIRLDRVENLIRVGAPAEEIVRVARERQVHLIVVGSQGYAFRHRLRRLILGSISRRVLRLAPCPVMIVVPPNPPKGKELTIWYETAIKQYLREQKQSLAVLTPQQVAQQFLPPNKKTPGNQEFKAATEALEHLAQKGTLFRHQVGGEVRYIND